MCGDGASKSKRRGFIYHDTKHGVKDHLSFACQNCGEQMPFGKFLEIIDPHLHAEYLIDLFKESDSFSARKTASTPKPTPVVTKPKIIGETHEILSQMDNIQELYDVYGNAHPALMVVQRRKIPLHMYKHMYFAESYKSICEMFNPLASENIPDDARIVMPSIDPFGHLECLHGRALNNPKMRYIIMKRCNEASKVYGLDRVNKTKPVFCVEGSIDSMFLPNALASNDADLLSVDANFYIWDADKFNMQIVNRMKRAVDAGKWVLVWHNCPFKGTDINDMFIKNDGMTQAVILGYMKSHFYKGLMAHLEIDKWRRC